MNRLIWSRCFLWIILLSGLTNQGLVSVYLLVSFYLASQVQNNSSSRNFIRQQILNVASDLLVREYSVAVTR